MGSGKKKSVKSKSMPQLAAIPGPARRPNAELRAMFAEEAKKYLGLPYSELDCCGLIRKVMIELRHEFGFRVLDWNQNYLFDTLPIDRTAETAEIGDIIFFEGTYNENLAAKHRRAVCAHNIVHVEIFLKGESGELSISSRVADGVQLRDPYHLPC